MTPGKRPPEEAPLNEEYTITDAELSPDMLELYESACAVREHAYAPYSGFRVGAALRTSNGRIYTGFLRK